MRIKMIVTDIDGTLVTDDKRILPRTKQALMEAHKQGGYVVLCTGRPVSGIYEYLDELSLTGGNDYAITFNGARAINCGQQEVVFENGLTNDECQTLTDLSNNLKIKGQIVTLHSEIFVTDRNISKYSVEDAFYTHMALKYRPFDELPSTLDAAKYMWVDDPVKVSAKINQIPSKLCQHFAIVRSSPWFVEFSNPIATKGHAVLELADHLGIKKDEIMVAGDENNDLSMFEQVPFSVAMGNGNDQIKKTAKIVTADNNHDGLGIAIEKYVLNDK